MGKGRGSGAFEISGVRLLFWINVLKALASHPLAAPFRSFSAEIGRSAKVGGGSSYSPKENEADIEGERGEIMREMREARSPAVRELSSHRGAEDPREAYAIP